MSYWVATTLRKGTKTPKICRDMFITKNSGGYQLIQVKNGSIHLKVSIGWDQVSDLIYEHSLILRNDFLFKDCYTYRKAESFELIDELMAAIDK